MPWQERTKMSLKLEFVMLADQDDVNMSALCRRFEISRKTGYKWLGRYRAEGPKGLEERSRRPRSSPNKTPAYVEEAICAVRQEHPAWGGRKIRARLLRKARRGQLDFAAEKVPAASTCQAILKRRGWVEAPPAERHTPAFQRFEKETPNELWQMDFKGHFPLVGGQECHPLTILDDHSRFALALAACPNERRETVQKRLTTVFRRYGLPRRILCDNGLPWGVPTAQQVGRPLYTKLNAWLFRLGIDVVHGRPYHPQTQGKGERFHRSLNEEVLRYGSYHALPECQTDFDQWRAVYNLKRPHEALGLEVPASRYQPSGRAFPEQLPPIEYGPDAEVRTVATRGTVCFQGQRYYVGEAFAGDPVGLRPADPDRPDRPETWAIYYCHKKIHTIDLNCHNR